MATAEGVYTAARARAVALVRRISETVLACPCPAAADGWVEANNMKVVADELQRLSDWLHDEGEFGPAPGAPVEELPVIWMA